MKERKIVRSVEGVFDSEDKTVSPKDNLFDSERKIVGAVAFDDLPPDALIGKCRRAWREKGFCALFTPNALMLRAASRDEAIRRLLNTADVSAVDGDGVLLAARRRGVSFRYGKNAGVELGERLLREGSRRGERVFLYGGRPGVAEVAARRLRQEMPRLRIVGLAHGYGDGEEVARRVKESGASLTLVCLGFPKQEQWIAANGATVGGILAGLGGSLDVYAGRVRRAPRLFRRLRLEWLWRCLLEPRRLPAVLKTAVWLTKQKSPALSAGLARSESPRKEQ